ncbi:GNAT family N-acetyltransferase [Halobacillus litoralis]|uniref:GNAT family N-acetyltransferase n=1 Tax=Halobacillus litoralis TaxID=45668 RepID=UPI00248FE94B|nr:GNAT family N-acetyltransferase [Halobacillus litoralis]
MKHKIEYKVASTAEEFEQIEQLNYETFVEEIPQHEQNHTRRLKDKFHKDNTYIVAKNSEEVVGMIAVRAKRPFSLDHKLPNIDDYLEEDTAPCEIRLLSVKEAYRKRTTFFGLIDQLSHYCLSQKFNVALISGTDRELTLYKKLGFQPFAHRVGTEGARFQPMKLTKEKFVQATQAYYRIMARYEPISFLSGPVPMEEEVAQSLSTKTISHRSEAFIDQMKCVRKMLCEKTGASYASVMVGTGTLANDIVAQQIKQKEGTGLILSNGEFGERLIDHAKRAGLSFHTIRKHWNIPISIEEIRSVLDNAPYIRWIWTVHCETSTSYLFDLKLITETASEYGAYLFVDACSSLGVDDVNLENVYMASSVSGKGLGAYPGLAIVFHQDQPLPNPNVPRYLDLGLYANHSTPFTHSSNSLHVLRKVLERGDKTNSELMVALRTALSEQNWTLLGDHTYSKGIVTIELPDWLSSIRLGDRLKKQGIYVNYESSYLNRKNWIQVALMGAHTQLDIVRLTNALDRLKHSELKKVLS